MTDLNKVFLLFLVQFNCSYIIFDLHFIIILVIYIIISSNFNCEFIIVIIELIDFEYIIVIFDLVAYFSLDLFLLSSTYVDNSNNHDLVYWYFEPSFSFFRVRLSNFNPRFG